MTGEVYDTINYNIKVNTANCGLVSTEDLSGSDKIIVYPIPANDFINLEGVKNPLKIELYNMSGQEIINSVTYKNSQINISSLQQGIYFLHLQNQKGLSEVHKVVKN